MSKDNKSVRLALQSFDKDFNWEIEKNEGNFLVCKKTGKNFKIIKQEKDFLNNFKLPEPQICFKQRHLERMGLRSKRKLKKINCYKCNNNILSAEEGKVHCDQCY